MKPDHIYKTHVFLKHEDETNKDFETRINNQLKKLTENCDGTTQSGYKDKILIFNFSYPIDEENSKPKLGFK